MENSNKQSGNRFVNFLTNFFSPLYDDRFGFFHFFYGFPKNNILVDLVIGYIYSMAATYPWFAPKLPDSLLVATLVFVVAVYLAFFLIADIFGRKRMFTAVGAILGILTVARMIMGGAI